MKKVTVIHKGFLDKRQLTLILALILLLGCIIPMAALIPSVEADVPSATGSHLAYWHFNDGSGDMWSSTNPDDADDSGTTERQETQVTPTNVGYGFAVRANMDDDSLLDEALYFKDNGQIHGEAFVELSPNAVTGLPDEITFYADEYDGTNDNAINSWHTTVSYRDDGKYTFYIDIDGAIIPAGHKLVLGINFEAQIGITTITFHTSGDTWFNLPLVVGSDGGDGDGDGDGDGTDGNATNGDEEDNSTVLMIIVIVVIVLVMVAMAIGMRRKG